MFEREPGESKSQDPDQGLMADSADGDEQARAREEGQLLGEPRAAGGQFGRGRPIARWGAAGGGRDVDVAEPQRVARPEGLGAIGESRFMEGPIEPPARVIAREHPPGPVGAVPSRCEADENDSGVRISVAGHGSAPMARPTLPSFPEVFRQSGTRAASDDSTAQRPKRAEGLRDLHLRRRNPISDGSPPPAPAPSAEAPLRVGEALSVRRPPSVGSELPRPGGAWGRSARESVAAMGGGVEEGLLPGPPPAGILRGGREAETTAAPIRLGTGRASPEPGRYGEHVAPLEYPNHSCRLLAISDSRSRFRARKSLHRTVTWGTPRAQAISRTVMSST